MKNICFLFSLILFITPFELSADTFYSRDHGDWNDVDTWYQNRHGEEATRIPGPGDQVVVVHKIYRTGDLEVAKHASLWIIGIGRLTVEGDVVVMKGGKIDNFADLYAANLAVFGRINNFGMVNAGEVAVGGFVDNLGVIDCIATQETAPGEIRCAAGGSVQRKGAGLWDGFAKSNLILQSE